MEEFSLTIQNKIFNLIDEGEGNIDDTADKLLKL